MAVIGVTEDLLRRDGRPWHPAVDLAAELPPGPVLRPIEIPPGRLLAPADIAALDILVLGDCGIAGAAILSSPDLRMICRFGKGYNDIDVAAATARGIVVTRVVKAGEASMATGVMALILALSTRLMVRVAIVRDEASHWEAPLAHGAVGLKEKMLGIIGYGRIGQEVANRARSFGMKVIFHDPYPPSAASAAEATTLDDLMARSDFVSVNCPLTPKTRNLISLERLRLMKPSAYLINTGRGAVVDEEGLCSVLWEGRIAGAALDVFAHEPLPFDSPLRTVPDLIMTPHAIGVSDEMYAEYMRATAAAIREFMAGSCPGGAVNPEAFRGK